jgi:hypothetical protein
MKARSPAAAAGMLVVFIACIISGQVLAALNGNFNFEQQAIGLAFIAFMGVGALVVSRRPQNRIGWLFSAVGLLAATGSLAMEYAEFVFVTEPSSLPGGTFAAWYAAWFWFPLLGLTLIFPILLFPTGHTLSTRWRPVLWIAAIATVSVTVLAALTPRFMLQNEDVTIANPIGVSAIGDVEQNAIGVVLYGALVVCVVLAFIQLIMRFRRSTGVERQQLKTFTFATSLTALAPLNDLLPGPAELSDLLFGVQLALPPIAAGVAILRYRLYDIDRIINKTIVYAVVTGSLLAVYAATVFIAGTVVVEASDNLTVAAATLAAAAAFRPLMRRVQGIVDRRFYRRKYDAQKTIDEFGSRLRQEPDLGYLTQDLVGIVNATMQPEHVSIWLRQSPGD